MLPLSAIVGVLVAASVPLDAATHQLSFSNTGWGVLVVAPALAFGDAVRAAVQPSHASVWLR